MAVTVSLSELRGSFKKEKRKIKGVKRVIY